MSNENPGRPGRTNGAAPMGSTVAIVVTLVALVLGFLILRKVNDTSSTPENTTGTTTGSTIDPGASTTAPVVVTTTTVPLIVSGTQLQVANASNQDGVAGAMTTVLQAEGFTMAEAVSATEKLEVSKVLYDDADPAAKALAESLADFLGITAVAQGLPVPVQDGTWAAGSGAILMLGNDFAGKTLAEIRGEPTTGTTTPPTTT